MEESGPQCDHSSAFLNKMGGGVDVKCGAMKADANSEIGGTYHRYRQGGHVLSSVGIREPRTQKGAFPQALYSKNQRNGHISLFVVLFGFCEYGITRRREEESNKAGISSCDQSSAGKSTCMACTMHRVGVLVRQSMSTVTSRKTE